MKGLSLFQYKSGEIDDALQTALSLHHFNMAEMATISGQTKAESGEILPLLGEISRQKGDTKKAIEYWEMLLKDKPGHIRGTLALIELYHKTKNHMR